MSDAAAGTVSQAAVSEVPASASAEPSAAAKEVIRRVYLQAFGLLRSGSSEESAAAELQKEGLDAATAAKIAANMATFIRQMRAAYRRAGLKSAGVGGLMCVVGIVITVVTLAAASGGGTYVVAWGAMIFGLIQAIRGLVTTGRQPSENDVIRAFKL